MQRNTPSKNSDTGRKRAYRSHSSPACLACRKRKSRCTTRPNAEMCVSCELHETGCIFPVNDHAIDAPHSSSLRSCSTHTPITDSRSSNQIDHEHWTTQERLTHERACVPGQPNPFSASQIQAENPELNSHIVSPALAEDNEILRTYLADEDNTSTKRIVSSSESSRIVLFTSVPRRPVGATQYQSLAATKCEIIEKLIGPNTSEILMLYFQCANKCFPIFDDLTFNQILVGDQDKLSRALVANLYANALTYWSNSRMLQNVSKPDQRFTWVLANEALHSELFLSPGVSTIIAILLNIGGRPSTSLFGNGSLLGSAIGLANALGLNRDPSMWNITSTEKAFRARLWWIIIVYDRWCSLSYGTPLQINRLQHNIPLPVKFGVSVQEEDIHTLSSMTVFHSLLSLTEVLGLYLECVYRIDKEVDLPAHTTVGFEDMLSQWENQLPDQLRKAVVLGHESDVAGVPNLRLGYLAVTMLLRRIQSKSEIQRADGATQYFEAKTVQAASSHVSFLSQLQAHDLKDFWLPMYAQSLTSVATFLLRVALKHKDASPNAYFELTREMMALLKNHLDNGWDLAADCLSACQPIFDKVEALLAITSPLPSGLGDLGWPLDDTFDDIFNWNGTFENTF